MPTNKQRREAARRHLERQLQRRQERDAARKRFTLIASITGTLVVIVVLIVVITMASGDNKKSSAASTTSPSTTPSATTSSGPTCGSATEPTVKVRAAKGAAVSFMGVTVGGATDLGGKPVVTSKGTTAKKLEIKDLVVGRGAAATPTSCATVQYDGVLYKNGSEFDSSWKRGQTAQFPLTNVIPGFTQGIGGTTGVPPMKSGGRRIIIIPSALGYGAQGSPPSIPANSDLVFVVDLISLS